MGKPQGWNFPSWPPQVKALYPPPQARIFCTAQSSPQRHTQERGPSSGSVPALQNGLWLSRGEQQDRALPCLLAPFPRASVSSLLGGVHEGTEGDPTPALSALPMRGQRWGAQPWKPPLCYPSGFQFGFELQLPGGGPRGPEGSGVWAGWTGRTLSRQHPAHILTQPRPSQRPEMGTWSFHPQDPGFPQQPSLPGPNSHFLHLPSGWQLRH